MTAVSRISVRPDFENPFVGLRAFEPEEYQLFFGRDKQIGELIEKLRNFRFLAVIGNSGCGKSSLVKAGLIPKLKGGFPKQEYDQWTVAIMRPSNDPLYYLAESIIKSDPASFQLSAELVHEHAQLLKQDIIYKGPSAAYDKIREISQVKGEQTIFLLLVDQFEELFDDDIKYKTGKNGNEANIIEENQIHFINTLLDLSQQLELPVYVIITMRSDFLGHCNQFFGLPEMMNQGQYLVPRLDREQRRAAIERPVHLFNAEINSALLNRLLNDSDSTEDELPVLQHAMMRTWQNWEKQKETDKEEIQIKHYESAGGMSHALSMHANDIYSHLMHSGGNGDQLERNKRIARVLFKSLTNIDEKGRRVRRPQKLSELTGLCSSYFAATDNDLKFVINAFREGGNAFLSPYKGVLYPYTEIDISHESLIRKWDKLNDSDSGKGWITEEQEAARIYLWLAENSNEKRQLLQKDDLRTALQWREKNSPNETWAARYSDTYVQVSEYIDDSIECVKEEEKKVRRRKRRYLIIIGAIGLLLITILVVYSSMKSATNRVLADNVKLLNKQKDDLYSADSLKKELLIKNEIEKVLTKKNVEILQERLKTDSMLKKIADESLQGKLRAAAAKAAVRARLEETERQIDTLQKLVDINNFQKLPFYSSNYLDISEKEKIVNQLLLPLKAKKDSIGLEKLKHSLNYVVEALKTAQKDANIAFGYLQKANQLNSNFLVDSIGKSLLKDHLFYRQKIDIGYVGLGATLLINTKGDKLIFSSDYGKKMGTYRNGRLDFGEFEEYSYRSEIDNGFDDYTETMIDSATTITPIDDTTTAFMDPTLSSDTLAPSPSTTEDSLITVDSLDLDEVYSFAEARALYNENQLLVLENNRVYLSSVDSISSTRKEIGRIPKEQLPSNAAFSPDGSLLITDDRTGILRFWEINEERIRPKDSIVILPPQGSKNAKVSELKFSADGKEFLVVVEGDMDNIQLWTVKKELINTFQVKRQNEKFVKSGIDDLDISASGNFITAILEDNTVLLWNRNGKSVNMSFLKPENPYASDILISPQGKYLFIKTHSASLFVDIDKKISKILPDDGTRIHNARFLDDNSLLTYNSGGEILLWSTQLNAELRDLLKPNDLIYLHLLDKYKLGLIDFSTILTSFNNKELLELSFHFAYLATKQDFQTGKESLMRAEQLLEKARLADAAQSKRELGAEITIQLLQNVLDKQAPVVNYTKIIGRVNQVIHSTEKYINTSEGKKYKGDIDEFLSVLYAELAWDQLFNREFKNAYLSVSKAKALDSTDANAIKNSALCLLLNNMLSQAEGVYLKFMKEEFEEKYEYSDSDLFYNYYEEFDDRYNITYKDIFKKDLELLVAANIISLKDPRVVKILELLEK